MLNTTFRSVIDRSAGLGLFAFWFTIFMSGSRSSYACDEFPAKASAHGVISGKIVDSAGASYRVFRGQSHFLLFSAPLRLCVRPIPRSFSLVAAVPRHRHPSP
jgi:hypothetical protein